ncbi:MAG: ATP-grasp domain-containing protein [Selenomonadaceae bacterium]|nr:ATP-grasp domain-containing protein [Selenomonadaceae bacterium]
MNILILSCGTRCLLVDYFMERENGFDKVITTDCSPYSPALYRSDKHYIVPRMNDENYLPTILDICKREDVKAVLPLHEDECVLIAKNQRLFKDAGVIPLISSPEVVDICRDKYEFYRKITENNLPAIPTYLANEADKAVKEQGFPLFIKPRFGAGSVSSYVINSLEALEGYMKNEDVEFIIQPYIKGRQYDSNAYIDFLSGKLADVFILEKMRMRAGEADKSISVLDERILSVIEKSCDIFQFCGAIDMDIIELDGMFMVMEVNPRFGGTYPHTHSCGVNFVRLIANNAQGKTNNPQYPHYEPGVVAFRYMDITIMREKELANEA